MDQDESVQHLF